MSLPPRPLDPIPADTARVAHAAFPKGSLAITVRDLLGTIYHDGMFADLYPDEGQPALTPWRLALILVLQDAEDLSDRQAAHAVRGRIDWKYALSLSLEDEGFDASVLSTFRERLVASGAEERLLWALLEECRERGLLHRRGRQRTDSTHVLGAVRDLNRLELVGETLRAALEAVAVAAPDWLRPLLAPEWEERYGRRIEEYRFPAGMEARGALAEQIGRDGQQVLQAIAAPTAPPWLRELPAVGCLQRVWEQQYEQRGTGLAWRQTADLPPASTRIVSPYDQDVRWGEKRQEGWVGFKVHITETCDDAGPALIVGVRTTSATAGDQTALGPIHADLVDRDLVPGEHLVDTGYIGASGLVAATALGIRLIGPLLSNTSRQARANQGYAARDFTVDWEAQRLTCPAGKEGASWRPISTARGTPVIQVHFRKVDCGPCPFRMQCAPGGRRSVTLLPRPEHEARHAALAYQATEAFQTTYHKRAGIEGTIAQAVRVTGMRQTRFRGINKVHLGHCAQATALNLMRLVNHHHGIPRATTRQSHLIQLMAQAA